jgi:acid phosphatase family membrane protein YuiD
MVVIYDATGIRRQAGRHATIINTMFNDFLQGHPEHGSEKLKEVLGHSPGEAAVGILMGILLTQAYFYLFV